MANSSESRDEPRASTERPSEARIKAVAERLAAHKEQVDRPAKPASIDLGSVSRSIAEAVRSPSGLPGPSSSLGGLSIPGDSKPVGLPGDRALGRSGEIQPPHEEKAGPPRAKGDPPSPTIGATSAGRPALANTSVEAQVGPASMLRPSVLAPVSNTRSDMPTRGDIPSSQSRVEGNASVPLSSAHRAIPFASPERSPSNVPSALGSMTAVPNNADAAGGPAQGRPGLVAKATNLTAPSISSKSMSSSPRQDAGGMPGAAVLRDHLDVYTPSSRAAQPGPSSDRASAPATSVSPSMGFVRNPMASDMRGLSSSGPAGPASGHGGMGQGAADFAGGGSPSSQSGNSVDLSKTNELLQQLIDAVRKQSDSSLPAGGRSVYPER